MRLLLQGEVPSPLAPPPGCPFHTRCPLYAERGNPACARTVPPLEPVGPGHRVACHEVTGTGLALGDQAG
jgi:oligopeptide/dipeptide ABC transporter ATP-binding protein